MQPAPGGALEGALGAAVQRPRTVRGRGALPAGARLSLALTIAAAALALGACAPQSVRLDEAHDAESAARDAILLEPGPPPVIENRLLFPLRSASRGDTTRERRAERRGGGVEPELRVATRIGEYRDTWARIRSGLAIDREVERPRVQREIDWYRRHQDYLDRTADRARLYLSHITREVARRGMPGDLALLPVVESAFQPFAYSPMAASGLWQFIPSTGRLYGLKQNWWYDGRRDVVESTRAALDYLQKLHKEFDGDWLLAIAAYNSGEGNVHKAIARNRRAGKPTDFWSLALPRETRAYVPRLLGIAEVVADPARHSLALKSIPDAPYFARVELDGQIDLALAAEIADVSLDEIYLLNPGFNRWATDPEGPHRLVLPVDVVAGFEERLAAVPLEERVKWSRHVIAAGENLGSIAHRYHTSVDALREANGLHSNRIRAGRSLMVPVAMRAESEYQLSSHIRAALKRVAPTSGRKLVHRVRPGENLWLIARRYRVPVKKLAAWNGLRVKGIIRPGQKLAVWTGRGKDADTPTATAASAPEVHHHVVRRGDTLSGIAHRYGTSVNSLVSLNEISRKSVLSLGQRVRVRVDASSAVATPVAATTAKDGPRRIRYTVRRGDSLWIISRRFNVTVASLREWNELPRGRHLRPGQELDVYVSSATKI